MQTGQATLQKPLADGAGHTFLYPKAGIARSTRGKPSSLGFAFVYFTVQRVDQRPKRAHPL